MVTSVLIDVSDFKIDFSYICICVKPSLQAFWNEIRMHWNAAFEAIYIYTISGGLSIEAGGAEPYQ